MSLSYSSPKGCWHRAARATQFDKTNPIFYIPFVLLILATVSSSPAAAQWLNYPQSGIPRLPDGRANLTAAAPKLPGGLPDLSGVWAGKPDYFRDLANDLKPGELQLLPWARALQEQREKNDHGDDPLAHCMPPGVPRIDTSNDGAALHPFKIIQTPLVLVLLYETSANSIFRQVFRDGRPLPRDPQPAWLGYSIGNWQGNSLVVETTGFNGRAWLDTFKGHPQTDAAKVIERFTRRDFGHMTLQVTIDDPKAYVKAWTVTLPLTLLPDTDLIETVCENPRDREYVRR